MLKKLRKHWRQADEFLNAGEPSKALPLYKKAVAIEDSLHQAHYGIAACCVQLADPKLTDLAVCHITKALRISPTVQYLDCAVLVFLSKGIYDVALHYQRQATSLEPTAENVFKLSDTYKKLGDLDNALQVALPLLSSEDAVRDLQIPMHLASIYLTMGDYTEGWKYWEWRRNRKDLCRNYRQGLYWGGEDLSDKILFLYGEQGFGDIIQFSRFILTLKEQYPTVTIKYESSQPLQSLFKYNFPIDELIDIKTTPEAFDYHCSLLSLPFIFNITADKIPYTRGYLKAEPEKVEMWKSCLGPKHKKIRAGLVWQGQDLKKTGVDRRRNIPFDTFVPILESTQKTVEWVSLQLGTKSSYLLLDHTDQLTDFSMTAALISCLDVVITVDTAVAHLSSALGIKTLVLSRMDGCWRWGNKGNETVWYETAEVLRQQSWLHWQEVMLGLQDKLKGWTHDECRNL